MRDASVIMDIGSSSIVVLIGENGVNHTFNILGRGEVSYAGFQNGEFFEPENLKFVIASAISYAELEANAKITDLYIGVPGEFSSCVTKSITLEFPRQKRISKFDIDNMFETGAQFQTSNYSLINKSVVYYELDGATRVINPLGMKAKTMVGQISYILAQSDLLKQLKSIFSELKINISGFISSVFSECMSLFEPSLRDRYVLMVDCGYLTTSVAVARGNALLFLNSFSMGGAYISSDLSQCLKISFNEAKRLKHKVVLGWDASPTDTYQIDGDEYMLTYSAKAANEIVMDRVEMIAKYIQKCLDRCEYDLPDFLPIYITGGGLCTMKGMNQYLSQLLNRRVLSIYPKNVNIYKPYDASEDGLLDFVLNKVDSLDEIIVNKK